MAENTGIIYQITIIGRLDPDWSDWLGALSVRARLAPDGSYRTILSGPIPDQAALRGILTRIWDLNLELAALKRMPARR